MEHEQMKSKIVIGLTEKIRVIGRNGIVEEVIAKIDTGATKSSIDDRLATKLNLGPILKSKLVKSAHGNKLRPVVEVDLHLADEDMKEEFTLADRSHMRYKVLLGVNVLEKRFLIDPSIKMVDNSK
ncbi:ATP-dependent zinc protease [Candidatus Woesearchaeota archaeon]|nr:ATP-dependent zinc protease [Candidatus Woesearchaeota archaeon]